MAIASSSSSSSTLSRWNYDVFLSFRGEDTRKNFVDHLYMALQQKGIYTFRDDKRLERGKPIAPELLKAIKESRFSVIVFSKNYASSSWCLDELVEIIECNKNMTRQIVLPVFYNVDPSEVRKQTGNFAKAFAKHEETFWENKEKVQRWRAALVEAANLSGWDLNNIANGHEAKFIQEIVQEIFKKLENKPLSVAKHEVGIVSRVNKVISLLDSGLKKVHIVGICGTGGIGKTTIAKAVFNRKFDQFESHCFLQNVREDSENHGLMYLQQQLLNDILMEEDLKICNVDHGINVIKRRLQHKKVLVVIDDVNRLEQLESLVGGNDWFGLGSEIIITTRDKRLLEQHEVLDHEIYMVEPLNDDEALQLFSSHAFTKKYPEEEYLELSQSVITYAQGLPLALQVLGSDLFKRSITYWEDELDRLKRIPNRKIYNVLKISFDGLDDTEKDLFLDIACFFKGYDKDEVMSILGSSGFPPRILVLIERSLITISFNNKLQMHDLIQEMGKEIVRQVSPNDPGKRSRLWFHEDIYKVLQENTVTETIEGIMLNMPKTEPKTKQLLVSVDVFQKMRKLRVLKVSDVQLSGCHTYLSNELSYLDWNGYPKKSLPPNFHPEKLVKLCLRHSQIKQISMDIKFLEKLKFLSLSGSIHFNKTPDFSKLPCLEELYLQGCTSLVEVHSSIGLHKRLVTLSLAFCKNLKSLPRSIELTYLHRLDLAYCSKLEKFPEIQGNMYLSILSLESTAIKDLPSSIGNLNWLAVLTLTNCKKLKSIPSNIWKLGSLENLDLGGCSKLKKLPEIEEDMGCLRTLHLDGTAIKELTSSIEHLDGLENLHLSNCKKLERIPSNIFLRMKNLKGLFLGGTTIKHLSHLEKSLMPSSKMPSSQMPSSFLRKKNPDSTYLQLESLLGLHSLTDSNLSECNLSKGSISNDLGCLSLLTALDLSQHNFTSLPASFVQLTKLAYLVLNCCSNLQILESLPSSILRISAHACKSLECYRLPPSEGCPDNRRFIFCGCHKLVENQRNNMPNILSESQLQEIGGIILPGSEIPYWFSQKSEDSSVSLRVDQHYCSNVKGIAVCAVLEYNGASPGIKFVLKVNGYSISIWFQATTAAPEIVSDHIILFHKTHYRSNEIRPIDTFSRKPGPIKNLMCKNPKPSPDSPSYDECYIEASVHPSNKQAIEVKKWGIHLVMEEQGRPSNPILKLKGKCIQE